VRGCPAFSVPVLRGTENARTPSPDSLRAPGPLASMNKRTMGYAALFYPWVLIAVVL